MCADRGAGFRLIETTKNLARVIGVSPVIRKLIFYLKEDDSLLRKTTMKTISEIAE